MTSTKEKPKWLRRRLPPAGHNQTVIAATKGKGLHTVCVEAQCPNQLECFSRGTATFLLLGPNCTRRCTFCAVGKQGVHPVDPEEPQRTAESVAKLNLEFCVITMVTRDDLPDGGARHIARTVEAIRRTTPGVGIELLISDLKGRWDALDIILETGPEVLNHNIETVPPLYPEVRPQADYRRSLELLRRSADHTPALVTKSGMMLGLGETKTQVLKTLDDLRSAGCQLLTLGQYLAPSEEHHPVIRYVPPEEFALFEQEALARGFSGVASAPLVRSSYKADRLYALARERLFPAP